MATTLPNTGAVIPAMTEPADQAVNNAAFTAIDAAVGAHLAEMTTQLNLKANKAKGTEYTATLQNNWVGDIKYSKNDLNQVRIAGGILDGTRTYNTVICSLPADYRPTPTSARIPIPCLIGGYGVLGLSIAGDGNIYATYSLTSTTGAVIFDTVYQL